MQKEKGNLKDFFASKFAEFLDSGPHLICRNPPSRASQSFFSWFPQTEIALAGVSAARADGAPNHTVESGSY